MSPDMFERLKEDKIDIISKINKCGDFDKECFHCCDIYKDLVKIVNDPFNGAHVTCDAAGIVTVTAVTDTETTKDSGSDSQFKD